MMRLLRLRTFDALRRMEKAMKRLLSILALLICMSPLAHADDLKTLNEKKLSVAKKGLQTVHERIKAGVARQVDAYFWEKKVLEAQLALAKDDKARLVYWEQHLQYLQRIEKEYQERLKTGSAATSDAYIIQVRIIDAQIAITKLKKTSKKK